MGQIMVIDNFWANCDVSGGQDACWPFLRSKNSDGYGNVWVNKRIESAHRVAYMLSRGAIPIGPNGKTLLVRHSCDNPPCCNPKHLLLGDHLHNAGDRVVRLRSNSCRGEKIGGSKLTTKQILFIKRCRDLFTSREMAKMLGVTFGTVSRVLQGRGWVHIPDEWDYRASRGKIKSASPLGAAAMARVGK